MNTPNPLLPQGALQPSRGKSNVRIAVSVFTVIALHAVFFSGLLMQGCKRDTDKTAGSAATNTNSMAEALGKLDTSYLGGPADLPRPATNTAVSTSSTPTTVATSLTGTPPASSEIVAPAQPITQTPASLTPMPTTVAETPEETKEYTVIRGDNLTKIARAHGVTVGDITKANPDLEPRNLKPGQKLQIPKPSAAPATAAANGTTEAGANSNGAATIHVVKAGDNLTKIAAQYKTTVKALRAANGLKTDRLLAGQKLKVPAPAAKERADASGAKVDRLPAGSGASPSGTNR